MAEDPATWGPVERAINDALKAAHAAAAEGFIGLAEKGFIGLSLTRRIADALRERGLIVSKDDVKGCGFWLYGSIPAGKPPADPEEWYECCIPDHLHLGRTHVLTLRKRSELRGDDDSPALHPDGYPVDEMGG